MVIAHIEEPFATGIAVFGKSLMEAMPDGMHSMVHGKRRKEMMVAGKRSINPIKGLFALAEIYIMLRRFKQKKFVGTVHFHSSKNGLQGGMYVLKPLTPDITLNSQIKAEMAA